MKKTVSALLLSLLSLPPACAAGGNPWLGTWKLNRAKSHLTGPTLTITRVPIGYHFDFGAVSYDIGDDGSDYPTVPTRTTSITAVGRNQWLRVHKVNGKQVDRSTIRVTADNATMLIHTIATAPDGTVHPSDDTEQRIGTGTGLAGTWRSTTAGINVSATIVVEDAGEGKTRRSFPGEGESWVAAPDGKPVPYQGPHAVPGVTVTLRAISANEVRWTDSVNGKPYTEGIDTLTAPGTLEEVTWQVTTPNEKQVAIYDRQ